MKFKVYVFCEQLWSGGKWNYRLWDFKLDNDPTRVFVHEREVEVDVPETFDPTPGAITSLKEEKQRILAEAHVKAENIEDQIQRLLCIEHKS